MPKIIVGMATIPERNKSCHQVIKRISPQVDSVRVYHNGSHDNHGSLKKYRNAFYAPVMDDIGANGKFFFLDYDWDYYFSIDDDFIYPENYVEKMIRFIDILDKKAVVCVHGSVFPPEPDWYFERVASFPARTENKTMKLVNLPGTATVAFHRSTLKNMTYKRFKGKVRCDLKLAIACLDQNVPIISIQRPANWLRPIKTSGPDYWSKMLVDDNGRTELAQRKNWSFKPNCYTDIKPDYWEEGSETHLITRERWLKKELYGIKDRKSFMKYDRDKLKENVKKLEEEYHEMFLP